MINRRKLLVAAGLGALAALPALARQEKRMRRIGYFTGGDLQGNAAWLDAFREGMAELRWVENRDYAMDARYGNGVASAYAGHVANLVATQPDLLLAPGDAAIRLLAQRTKTIPIVFATGTDPVGAGLAASLQRPGGNATGLTAMARDLGSKRLQLLKEASPRAAQVVLLFEPDHVGSIVEAKELEEAAQRLGIRITPIGLRQPADAEPALKRGTALSAHAYIVTIGGLLFSQRQLIADHLQRSKVPAIFPGVEFVEAGGLMSYGPSYTDNFRRAAAYVDKIFKGAKPGDLPIEQPVKFELVLNLKTAKAMGIKFPQSILVRVDRVIE